MPDAAPDQQETPENSSTPATPAPSAPTVCLRCKAPGPVSDDGFCGKCEQLMEQACL